MNNKTITIVNKLKKADAVGSSTDVFVKTVLNNCDYKKTVSKSVSGQTVSVGESIVVVIPFSEKYKPYQQWKTDTQDNYTMSQGDLIFLGLSLSEIPTSSNITTLKNSYECCEVRSVQVAEKNGMSIIQLMIEGV